MRDYVATYAAEDGVVRVFLEPFAPGVRCGLLLIGLERSDGSIVYPPIPCVCDREEGLQVVRSEYGERGIRLE